MSNRVPIIEGLISHQKREAVSWHVPGHKSSDLFPKDILQLEWDQTELPGLDDLHHPEGIIAESIGLLEELYGAPHSHFLVNGSTVGNWGMLAAVANRGDRIYVQRNSHKSVFNAMEWLGLEPVFLQPELGTDLAIGRHVSRETLTEAMERFPGGVAVFLTSPTYYGEAAKIEEIVEVTNEQGIPLLVDEAHGAHFNANFGQRSAFELGATAVVQSAHKTLPALTMAAWMHDRFTEGQTRRLKHALQSFQSSSPSYLLLASLDYARSYLASLTESDWTEIRRSHERFHEELRQIEGLEIFIYHDWTRFTLRYKAASGAALLEALSRNGIDAEFALHDHVVCLLPLAYLDDETFIQYMGRVRLACDSLKENQANVCIEPPIKGKMKVSELEYPFDSMMDAEGTWVLLEDSVGCVTLETLIPYPPGIPLLFKGERILAEHVEHIRYYLNVHAHIQGGERLVEDMICVLKEGQL
ncbi:aminotransferase class I/II-fold pyridoxal phosphate-dependent enzyme [Exiguobacterium flavidum]|uniref:aminotransferase class I/II-fold pyridoxal phosphate-dependent enzyme n=1 Tax=Exiguobacterium flavidum TaxID=2184695 RepID=UPI000DF82858|nr:aminotransferase class I/II-fold pyridoxal phosphate-dependent enzyme [Exiguobacterium flavidum]